MRGILSPNQPLVDKDGRATQSFWSFLAQQFGPQSAQLIALGASPFTWQAPNYRGVLFVSGGTVSAVTYSQDNTSYLATGQVAGCFPMAGNDFVKITYTVAPTLNYVPI